MYDEAGRGFVFVKPAGGWTNMTGTSKLRAPEVQMKEFFGESVSIDQNTIAVGAPGDEPVGGRYLRFWQIERGGAAWLPARRAMGW